MATYYHGAPEIQPDGLQTLYLMNPGYIGYSTDASTTSQANMSYLNSTTNSINQTTLNQHYVGIPVQQPPTTSPDMAAVHGLMPRGQYNLWNPSPVNNSADLTSQLGLRRPTPTQKGLSLSLSPQQANYGGYRPDPPAMISPAGTSSSASGTSNAVNSLQGGVLMGSKYLKATQELLEEVVNVGKGVKDESSPKAAKGNQDGEVTSGGETSGKRGGELSTAERQELQMKKVKLVNMLDEVEQRYRQYHHQMQIVISSFEAVAGAGSAKTYTALALQTISKQFRWLRDTITGQIRATGKSLGEEECIVGSKSEGGSRLRFVDHQLRQQRALQQLGMMQHNAWRPQRGLPERSVSVLRAWLFEHFLHPYPKDSDKHMLAKQTGLTRNQVSNWFINARVRLWKPMVEEMYLEETKEQEEQNNNDGEKTSKSNDSASKSNPPPSKTEQNPSSTQVVAAPTNTGYDEEGEESTQSRLKKARSNEALHQTNLIQQIPNMEMDMKPEEANNSEIFMRFGETGAGFGGYSIGDFSRFDGQFVPPRFSSSTNGVSLTLAPPHCEALQHPTFLNLSNDAIPIGRRLQQSNDYINMNNNQDNNSNNMVLLPHPPNTYDNLTIENRKRFAAQLLPDFLA